MIIYQVIVRYVYSGLHIFLAASGEEDNVMQLFQIAKEHRGTVLKFQVNQFALALFSLMVFVFTMQNKFTMFFCGLFTMAFYWYLIYHLMWNIGGKDRIRVDGGRAQKILWKGFYIGLLANLFNLLLAVMNLIYYYTGISWLRLGNIIARLWESMYAGWWQLFMPHNPLAHFLVVLPTICVAGAAYLIGYYNIFLSSFLGIKPKPAKHR